MSSIDIEDPKEAKIPSDKEKKEFQDIEMEIILQIKKSLEDGRLMESYFYSWASIEQFMLPRLIGFVARNLKISHSKEILESNISNIIKYYYFLSHDEELFLQLEIARKNRNNLTHKLYKMESLKKIEEEFKKCLKKDIGNLLSLFQDRFTGKTEIPVLTIYAKGWNDMRTATIKIINNF